VRFAYADPPYLGCCGLYDHYHPDGLCWDDLETHRLLIDRIVADFPDGWALSASEPSLRDLLPLTPRLTRTAPWVKPFASFKPNVNPAHAWEPVLFFGGRKRDRTEPTISDYVAVPITLRRGLVGAKPQAFSWWVFALLGAQADDEFVDLFPGTGGVTEAWERWRAQAPLGLSA
jgi:hypothetical protein